ncbi:MAG TPA: CHAD domain-containing protein [Vicinamibacterales bacterium]|nr:CHAD domain-containing protein [Vicinamibacterales bacterium]
MNRSLPLVRLLERRARALRRHLSAAVAGKDTGVHQARVASRRLREAVPVITEGLQHTKSQKAQRKLRRVTQALGAVRELDVTLHLIDDLADRAGVPPAALAEVRAHVMEAREERRKVMLARLSRVDTDKLSRRLNTVRDALQHPTPGHNWRPTLALRVVRRARRLDKAIEAAGQIYAPEALHLVRISAKKLRYALEIADESGAAPCSETVRTIKRVQETLGRLHDLQVLQHHAAAVGALPRSRRDAPDAGLAVLSRLIEDQCRHLHGRYVAALPTLRDAVEKARRDVPARLTARPRSAKMTLTSRRRAAAGQSARQGRAGGR